MLKVSFKFVLLWLLALGFWLLAVSRLEDGELNSRGFSNPWKASRFNYKTVWKTGISIPMDFQVLGHVAVPRLYRRYFYSSFCFHGLKSPRLFAFGFASFRRLVFVRHVRRLGGFDLCIVFNVLFLVCISLLRQWPMANS